MDWLISIIVIIVTIATPYSSTFNLEWEDETPYMSMSGCAAYYGIGVMEKTALNMGYIDEADSDAYYEWLESEGYIGAVAVYRLGDRGKDVYILWPDGIIDGPYKSIDVVAEHHYDLGLDKNRVIDVDYETAVRHDMRGPVSVTIVYDYSPLFESVFDGGNSIDVGITTEKYHGCIGWNKGEED